MLDINAYFLLKGKITFYMGQNIPVDAMNYGAFGLYEFYLDRPRLLSVRSNLDSLLYTLQRDPFI